MLLAVMWVFPLLAALIALAFAGLLARRYLDRRRPHEALWALALLMYAAASFAVVLGVLGDWSAFEYRAYWLLGAALNVPFLAAGEVVLLFRRPWVLVVVLLALVFVTGYSFGVVRTAGIADPTALGPDLPSGKVVFGAGTAAHRLPQIIAIPAYLMLVGGPCGRPGGCGDDPSARTPSTACWASPSGPRSSPPWGRPSPPPATSRSSRSRSPWGSP